MERAKHKSRSLRRTFLINLIGAIILPVLIVGGVAASLSYARMKTLLHQKNHALTSLAAHAMEMRLSDIHRDLEMHAHYSQASLADPAEARVFLDAIVEEYGIITSAMLTDRQGMVTCISPYDADVIGTDMSGHAFNNEIARTNKSYWSPRFVTAPWNRPLSSLSIPLTDGVFTVYFDLSGMLASIQALEVGQGTELAIVDQHGTYIAHSDPAKIQTSAAEPHYSQFAREFTGDTLAKRLDRDDRAVIVYVKFIGDTGWASIVYQDESQLLAPLKRMVIVLSGVTLAVVIIAVVLFSRNIRGVLQATARLRAGAGRIADGTYEPIVITEKFEEFTELADRFNFMARAIESRERRLRESEERFRAVVEQAGDAMFLLDLNGKVLDANTRACATLGYARDELLAMNAVDLGPLLPQEKLDEQLPTIDAGEGVTLEGVHLRKDGTTFPVEIRACRIELVGQPHILALARDITERRQLEEQVRHSQKMDAIGQLAGGIAHDFNNQLAGIMGYADVLARELQDNDELRDSAQAIVQAARRSADLTQQLLAFARKGKALAIPVDLHRVIDEVVSLLRHSIDRRIQISLKLDAETHTISGDPTQIQSALLNIALNARDAMDQGGTIGFQTELVELDEAYCSHSTFQIVPGRFLCVRISDTGMGMSAQTLQHIFEPFFTTKEPGRGTGMGMAAVYGTVKDHHGAVNIYSEVDSGTTVTLYFPLADAAVAEPKPTPKPAPATRSARILLIDDDEGVRNMATMMLRRLGHQVTSRTNGAEAVEYYRHAWNEIDLVILDMIMPKMNGRDAFIAMRQINPKIRALLSSGYSIDGEAKQILDEGMSGFLQKPFLMAELSEKLADMLI